MAHTKCTFVTVVVLITATLLTRSHGEPHWNSLNVRFNVFMDIPQTETQAVDAGFTKVSECDTSSRFRGKRYMKDGDGAVIPLYDINGYIAGLQTAIPKGLANGYPPKQQQPPFLEEDNAYILTAYFVDPSIICRRGRSEQQHKHQGTGTDLFIQTGDDPENNVLETPHEESRSSWTKGRCFPGMGTHYFHNVTLDMPSESFFPVVHLYYDGRLIGFVWSLGAVINSSYVDFEHPEPNFFEELLFEVPTFLLTLRRTTLHVYFTHDAATITCPDVNRPRNTCTSGTAMACSSQFYIGLLLTLVYYFDLYHMRTSL